MQKIFFVVLLFFPLALPPLVFAQPIVTCGNEYGPITVNGVIYQEGKITNPCEFKDIIGMSQRIINFLVTLGVMVATLGFAYAGFLYITAAGSMESIKHAHSIFVKVLIGFALMLGAWLIAKAFESVFLSEAAKARSFLGK